MAKCYHLFNVGDYRYMGGPGLGWLVAPVGEVTQGKSNPIDAVPFLLPVLTEPQGFQEGPQGMGGRS